MITAEESRKIFLDQNKDIINFYMDQIEETIKYWSSVGYNYTSYSVDKGLYKYIQELLTNKGYKISLDWIGYQQAQINIQW